MELRVFTEIQSNKGIAKCKAMYLGRLLFEWFMS